MKKIIIVLINYNGTNDTVECIKSIRKSSYKDYSIVVVDNASKKELYLKLKKNIDMDDNIILLRSEINLGFAGGNNLAIKYCFKKKDFDYILLLNNDTLIDENSLSYFVDEFLRHPNCGIVGGKIYYYPQINKIWYAGGFMDWKRFSSFHFGFRKEDSIQYNFEKEVDFVTGCGMMIKKEIFEKVGLLEESYFMYYEDTDFNVRVRDKGYKIYYNPRAIIYHKVSNASGGEESDFALEYLTRSRRKFMKNFKYKVTYSNYIYSLVFFYLSRIIKIFLYLFCGEKSKANAILKGIYNK